MITSVLHYHITRIINTATDMLTTTAAPARNNDKENILTLYFGI